MWYISGCNGVACCPILDMEVHEFGKLGFCVLLCESDGIGKDCYSTTFINDMS
jgi:hypothetical protein